MKPVWTLVLLSALGSSLWAQGELTYITNPGSGTPVRVFDSTTLIPLSATPIGPNPIVCPSGTGRSIGIPARNKIYVANRGSVAGVITIIDTQILKVVNTVAITGSTNLGGLAVSEDGTTLFIAGRRPAAPAQAGVFRLDLNDETTQGYVGGLNSTSFASDCDVVPASLVGGSGNGPGRVFFSVTADNVIGVLYLAGPAGLPTIVPPVGTSLPTQMERSPDGTFVLVGCLSANTADRRLIRIAPVPAANPADMLTVVITFGMSPLTTDVTFRSTVAAPPFIAYFCTQDPSGERVHEIALGASGAIADNGSTPCGAFTNEIRFDPFTNRVWVADLSGTGNTCVRLDAGNSPPDTPTTLTTGSTGPLSFVFMPAPPDPRVDLASPTGEVSTTPFLIEIKGAGFIPGSSKAQIFNLSFPVDATTTTVVNSGTIRATFPAQTGGLLWHVIVINNTGRSDQINQYFETLNANPPVPPFTVALPAAGQGYRLLSVPQYVQVPDLQAALSAQLGPYNPVLYRVFFRENDAYVELNQASPSSLTDLTGKSFWVLTRSGASLTLTAPDVTQNTPGGRRVTALTPGWNLVSQPWINGPTNTISYVNVQVSVNGNLVPLVSAFTSPAVSNQPFEFVNGQYVQVNQMTAGRGYWIENVTAATVYMVIDQGQVTLKPGPSSAPASAPQAAGAPSPPPPPGAVLANSGSSGGCGFLGVEAFLAALMLGAFRRACGKSRMTAG